ncbi:MAG TPA: hypothetical protein VFB38_08155 [Chthonomonadaceae bacterium]|nr:hypothetical protein [Chthonomonadaceae bacterium]
MKKLIALFAAVSILGSAAALAAPPAKGKKPAKPAKKITKTAKITDVWVCPMTGEAVTDHSGKGVLVGDKRVHFCCPSCEPSFNKLTAKEKKAKVAEAAKKEAAMKKKG